jgi:fructokinase
MSGPLRLGIDLGGSKIEIIALRDGQELLRRRQPTPRGDYPGTLHALCSLVRDTEAALGAQGSLGVGIPGTRSPDSGRLAHGSSTWLMGQDLQGDLQQQLGRPVRLANDADCFALSEACDGAAAGAVSMFGAILGTGVGGGLVIHGQLLNGPNAIAGEWGHNPLPWRTADDGEVRRCHCGLDDCIESFLGGPGWASRSGLGLSPQDIVRAAAAAQPAAQAAVARYCDQLARSLAAVINLLDPQVIVLGGGLSNIPQLYHEVPRLLPRHLYCEQLHTRLVPARFGDSSGVRGAAWLWP